MRHSFLICALIALAHPILSQPWTVGNTTLTQSDVVTGITRPWEILWGPDDYIWCTLRTGQVLHIDPQSGNYQNILDLGSIIANGGSGEPGMLGMALHPDFANTPKVFIVYCYTSGNSVRERLVSFDWNGTSLINETQLINNIQGNQIHNGSRLVISPDQKIMMTVGDRGSSALAQDISVYNGKVLRINLDGSIPSDNPDPNSYVWSYGHRNSQGLCYAPNGILYESEHGQSNSDEFNIIEQGRNYGWPDVEGACNTAAEQTFCAANNVREPLMEWSPCVAVNGIEYYNHPAIPEWSNSIIMGVMGGLNGTGAANDRISVLHLSEDGLSVTSEEKLFTSLNQRFRDVCVNPYTGALYVALNGTQYPGTTPNKIIKFENEAFVAIGVKNAEPEQTIKTFPNPANQQITFEVSSSLSTGILKIYTYDGQLVAETRLNGERTELNISNYKPGSYWYSAESAKGTMTGTFIVQ